MPDTSNLPQTPEPEAQLPLPLLVAFAHIAIPSSALVYGWPGGDLAFAPLDEARLYAAIRRGEGFPMTWGDFRSRFGEAAYSVSVQPFVEQAEYASLEEFLKDFDADDYGCSAQAAYRDLPIGADGRVPEDEDIALFRDSEGNEEDTPEAINYWPAQRMLDWFPKQIAHEYGRVLNSVHDGEFLGLDDGRCEEIVAALEALGFTCVEDYKLMDAAAGY